jgi:hypothetical protein
MIIQFALQDLMLFLLFVLGVAVGIVLLMMLLKAKKTIGSLQSMMDTNKESINKTIESLPVILENVGQISSDLIGTADALKVSIPNILKDVECVTHAAKASFADEAAFKKDTPGFMEYFHAIEEVLHIVARIFPSKK